MKKALIITLFALGTQLAFVNISSADCTYTAKGQLTFENHGDANLNGLPNSYPLRNVKVKLRGIGRKEGPYIVKGPRGEDRTDDQGKFNITFNRPCDGYEYRVHLEVKFKNSDQEIRHSKATIALTKVRSWTVENEDSTWNQNKEWKKNFKFKAGSGDHALDDIEANRQAGIWILTQMVRNHMDTLGPEMDFKGPVKIKLNRDEDLRASYANPFNEIVYIQDDTRCMSSTVTCPVAGYSTMVITHELMHLWLYRHSRGESQIGWQTMFHATSHAVTRIKPAGKDNVKRKLLKEGAAWQEGFAEYAANILILSRQDGGLQHTQSFTPPGALFNQEYRPFSRKGLKTMRSECDFNGFKCPLSNPSCKFSTCKNKNLSVLPKHSNRNTCCKNGEWIANANTLKEVAKHELGWWNLFLLLTTKELQQDLFKAEFNPSGADHKIKFKRITSGYKQCREYPRLSFKQLLKVFNGDGDECGQIRTRQIDSIDAFFGRASLLLEDVEKSDKSLFKELLNPKNQGDSPQNKYCEST